MNKPQKNVGRVSTRQATLAHGDVGLRPSVVSLSNQDAALVPGRGNPTYVAHDMDGWEVARLGDFCELRYGKIVRKTDLSARGYPVWSGYSVVGYHDDYMFEEPQVTITCRGVGGTGNIHMTPPKCWVTNLAISIIPRDQSRVDNNFLYWAMKSTNRSDLITGSAQYQITINHLSRHSVPLPPLPEQKAIAHILGTLDDKIELNRRMNATLEAMARALFQSWFVDFDPVRAKLDGRQPAGLDAATAALFPAHFQESPLGHIPQGWSVGTLSEGFNLTMGQSPPGDTYNEDGEGIPFYQGRTDFGFRFPTRRIYCTAPTRYAKPGDTLVSVRAPVGDINMADEECCIGRGVAAVRHKSGSVSFTYHAMENLSPDFALFEGEGTVFGSINKQSFENLRFVIPPQELVAAYEQIAKPLDDQIYTLEHQSRSLVTLREALLPKLLSGELLVAGLVQAMPGDGRCQVDAMQGGNRES